MIVVGLELVLRGANQEPGCGGMNLAICIVNSVGHLTGTVVSHDANNDGWDASAVLGYRNNILNRNRGRGRRRDIRLCRVILGIFIGS